MGYGANIEDASKPLIVDLDGKRLGVVNLCCPTTNGQNLATHIGEGVAPLGMELLLQAVQRARAQCDVLLAFLHWGYEWQHGPVPSMLRMARRAIDAGADAVVGCHSHTIQTYEQYKGRWIFHGLGNFFFGPATVQETGKDGKTVVRALTSTSANRESLAVSFTLGEEGKSLELENIQPFVQTPDLDLRSAGMEELTVDLARANQRLATYVTSHSRDLEGLEEPMLSVVMHDGIPNVRHSEKPVEVVRGQAIGKRQPLQLAGLTLRPGSLTGWKRGRRGARGRRLATLKARLLSLPGLRGASTAVLRKTALTAWIHAKWYRDKMSLPLTRDHWEIYDLIHRVSWRRLEKLPDVRDPKDYNDRVQWLKLFDQREEMVRLGDKIAVRDYIREKTGDRYLSKLLQVCDSFEEIDFERLPDRFVIKANNDSGNVVLVTDKAKLDKAEARQRMEFSLGRVYGWSGGEWHYAFMKPKLMVEEFLETGTDLPPADYRFHCVNGRVRWIQNDIPFEPKMKEVIVDPAGRPMKVHFSSHKIYSEEFTKPVQWEEMTQLADTLSAGWKYVRIDMFVCGDRIYAGEITFTPYAGFYKGEGQKVMGELLDFDRTTFEDPVMGKLAKVLRSVSRQ
ncbi:MAG: CapA family protein [Akkermansiaceae bacterium]|nr:CapA family protein [Akkermansiaceae bacterium]